MTVRNAHMFQEQPNVDKLIEIQNKINKAQELWNLVSARLRPVNAAEAVDYDIKCHTALRSLNDLQDMYQTAFFLFFLNPNEFREWQKENDVDRYRIYSPKELLAKTPFADIAQDADVDNAQKAWESGAMVGDPHYTSYGGAASGEKPNNAVRGLKSVSSEEMDKVIAEEKLRVQKAKDSLR